MFTHARCGGTLLPIPNITEDYTDTPVEYLPQARYLSARCDRCKRPGIVNLEAEYDLERRRLYRGLVRK